MASPTDREMAELVIAFEQSNLFQNDPAEKKLILQRLKSGDSNFGVVVKKNLEGYVQAIEHLGNSRSAAVEGALANTFFGVKRKRRFQAISESESQAKTNITDF